MLGWNESYFPGADRPMEQVTRHDSWPKDQGLNVVGWYRGNANDATYDVGLQAVNVRCPNELTRILRGSIA